MKFRSEIKIEKEKFEISHKQKLIFLGSCFSEQIGQLLQRSGFDCKINHFGVIYNPISIFEILEKAIDQYVYTEEDLCCYQNKWSCLNFHGSFSDGNPQILLQKINQFNLLLYRDLIQTNALFITLGTSIAYKYKLKDKIVANCHKIPQQEFDKIFISSPEIELRFADLYQKLIKIIPDVNIVFTISPVRHLKDGFIENQKSKANLLLSVHQLKQKYFNVYYFPVYEIMMDDLRDYRFYKEDLIHPNEMAIAYIFEKFSNTFFNSSTIQFSEEVNRYFLKREHRPLFPDTEEYQEFKNEINKEEERLLKILPHLVNYL